MAMEEFLSTQTEGVFLAFAERSSKYQEHSKKDKICIWILIIVFYAWQQLTEETLEHLFLGCRFAKDCWNLIGITIQTENDIFEAVDQIRDQSHPSFVLVAIIMCWFIWTARSDLILKGIPPSTSTVKALFTKEMKILSLRAKASLSVTFDLWIQNLS